MPSSNIWLLMVFVGWCGTLFVYDTLVRRVPNKLLMLAIALQLGLFVVIGHGLRGTSPMHGLVGFVIGLAFFLPLYALRAMAAGDVKFFAVIGLLLGPVALLPVFLIGSLLAGLHALVYTASRAGSLPGLQTVAMRLERWPFYKRILQARGNRVGIPYAAYLAVGAVWMCVYPKGL